VAYILLMPADASKILQVKLDFYRKTECKAWINCWHHKYSLRNLAILKSVCFLIAYFTPYPTIIFKDTCIETRSCLVKLLPCQLLIPQLMLQFSFLTSQSVIV
jgi:hypothetical protein